MGGRPVQRAAALIPSRSPCPRTATDRGVRRVSQG